MKYLIQNTKEFVITLGVFATFAIIIFWSVWSIIHNTFNAQHVLAIIGGVIEYLGWYYNMPTSEENSEATGYMRLQKLAKGIDPDFVGEEFFDEFEEQDEEEGEE